MDSNARLQEQKGYLFKKGSITENTLKEADAIYWQAGPEPGSLRVPYVVAFYKNE